MYTSEHPIINVTVDIIVNAFWQNHHNVLMVQRGHDPFEGKYALPGGFLNPDEDTLAAALRELQEETSIWLPANKPYLYRVASTPGRDPRGPTVSVVYQVDLVLDQDPYSTEGLNPKAGDDAAHAQWMFVQNLENHPQWFAFDHYDILFGKE